MENNNPEAQQQSPDQRWATTRVEIATRWITKTIIKEFSHMFPYLQACEALLVEMMADVSVFALDLIPEKSENCKYQEH